MSHTSKYVPPSDTTTLVLGWLRRARESQFCHYHEATRLQRANTVIGVPVVVITAVVGASALGTLGAYVPTVVTTVAIGIASIAASALAGLQTFLRLSERAEQHRHSASKYGAIRRRLEAIYANRDAQPITLQLLQSAEDELNELSSESPSVPDATYQRIQLTATFFIGEETANKELQRTDR